MIGIGILGRAELVFIVINIAYTENRIFDEAQFETFVFTIFLAIAFLKCDTTIFASSLRSPRYPHLLGSLSLFRYL